MQEFVEDSDMSDVLLVLLEIDLSSHRSIGLFILTIDSKCNVLSEITATWDLSNDMPGTICMTFEQTFQQTESFGCVCFSCAPKIQCACVTFCRGVGHTPIASDLAMFYKSSCREQSHLYSYLLYIHKIFKLKTFCIAFIE